MSHAIDRDTLKYTIDEFVNEYPQSKQTRLRDTIENILASPSTSVWFSDSPVSYHISADEFDKGIPDYITDIWRLDSLVRNVTRLLPITFSVRAEKMYNGNADQPMDWDIWNISRESREIETHPVIRSRIKKHDFAIVNNPFVTPAKGLNDCFDELSRTANAPTRLFVKKQHDGSYELNNDGRTVPNIPVNNFRRFRQDEGTVSNVQSTLADIVKRVQSVIDISPVDALTFLQRIKSVTKYPYAKAEAALNDMDYKLHHSQYDVARFSYMLALRGDKTPYEMRLMHSPYEPYYISYEVSRRWEILRMLLSSSTILACYARPNDMSSIFKYNQQPNGLYVHHLSNDLWIIYHEGVYNGRR